MTYIVIIHFLRVLKKKLQLWWLRISNNAKKRLIKCISNDLLINNGFFKKKKISLGGLELVIMQKKD